MRPIDLREYEWSDPIPLCREDLDTLIDLGKGELKQSLAIEPVSGKSDSYRLRPGSIVGAVNAGNLSLRIQPKIDVLQLLSLACYAIRFFVPNKSIFEFEQADALPDILARALATAAQRAFARGLLHGYRRRDESLYTVRGRIRFDEQLRRRFNMPLPVAVRYNEFTDDILANRMVKAAAYRLRQMGLRSAEARSGLGWVVGILDNVSSKEFRANDVPEVSFDRLNEHYRDVVGLSRLILRHSAFEATRGTVRAAGFLMDMNLVFQEFVTVALQETLGVPPNTFSEKWTGSLDKGGKVRIRPDLVWLEGDNPCFVGDVKYKNLTGRSVPGEDLYQLLAYVTALNLPGGMLIYAQGEAKPDIYPVRNSGKRSDKRLEVATLDLSGSLEQTLAGVGKLAKQIRDLRDEAQEIRRAA